MQTGAAWTMLKDYEHAAYMEYLVRHEVLDQLVAKSNTFLRGRFGIQIPDFDCLAFSGCSGMLVGSPLSLALKKPFIIIRKHPETHSEHICEGFHAAKKYVLVDDFVSSGKTLDLVVNRIKEWQPQAQLVGVLEVSRLWEDKVPYFHTKFPFGRRM